MLTDRCARVRHPARTRTTVGCCAEPSWPRLDVEGWYLPGWVRARAIAVYFPESELLGRAALSYWSETELIEEPDPGVGPIQVVVEYVVPRDRQEE